MAKAVGELQGSAPVYGGERTTRRGFILGAGAAGLALAVGASAKLMAGGGGEKPSETQEYVPVDYSVSAAEAEANLNTLVLPDLYEDRPWANPEQLVGLTPEELQEIAAVPVTPETTRTDEGFVKIFAQKLELIANAGTTIEDVRKARELGYPVGEMDSMGNYLGNYDEYAKSRISPMLNGGLFEDNYKGHNSEEVIAALENFLLNFADDFEYALTDEIWRGKTTLYITAGQVESQPTTDFDRRLSFNIRLKSPAVGPRIKDAIYEAEFIVNIDEGDDKFIVGFSRYGGFKSVES